MSWCWARWGSNSFHELDSARTIEDIGLMVVGNYVASANFKKNGCIQTCIWFNFLYACIPCWILRELQALDTLWMQGMFCLQFLVTVYVNSNLHAVWLHIFLHFLSLLFYNNGRNLKHREWFCIQHWQQFVCIQNLHSLWQYIWIQYLHSGWLHICLYFV